MRHVTHNHAIANAKRNGVSTMSHLTPSEFAALEVIAQERARIVAVLAPRKPRTPSISELLQPVRPLRPSLLRVASLYAAGLACAGLAGFYIPAPLARVVAYVIA